MNRRLPFYLMAASITIASCNKFDKDFLKGGGNEPFEDAATFREIASITVGGSAAAEISAFDPQTNRLFVVNNSDDENKIDVVDLTNPNAPVIISSIALEKYDGAVNSVDVNDGILAAAIESSDKQQNGKIVLFRTSDYSEVSIIQAGALPDMITYSPDGKYLLTANEGEPSSDYSNDPVGSVTIVDVKNNYSAVTIDFSAFASQQDALEARGLRIFGPGSSFIQDLEPEYITVSDDSRTAWVTLQENNAIAKIDLRSKSVTNIFPLGFKSYNTAANAIDPSDKDNQVAFRSVPVFGIYMPDAIAVLHKKNVPYLFTVNEGDAREYDAIDEIERVEDLMLDEAAFPNASDLQKEEQLGRLNVTTTLGDANNDGKYEKLYSLGARSFSVWNGLDGQLLYDSKNKLDKAADAKGFYDDGRSDDKGAEPEGITIGEVGRRNIAFIGMERADAVAIYDVTEPLNPKLLNVLATGDAPEGVLFVHKKDSPNKQSLLIVSSENDGVVRIYTPAN
jgi:hypothetical protein